MKPQNAYIRLSAQILEIAFICDAETEDSPWSWRGKTNVRGRRTYFGECGHLPKYILLSTLTDEGRKTVKEKPERIKEVSKEIEALGMKVLSQYAVLGPYDFVNIVEAPDNIAVACVSLELGSRGTVQITSLPAVPLEEFIAAVKKK